MAKKAQRKQLFLTQLQEFVTSLNSYVSADDGQWTIKGFIDVYKNIYTISSDTKIVSKLLEIHLFPDILSGNGMFAQLGEARFDDYWMNYGAITITDNDGKTKKITALEDFVAYRGGNPRFIVQKPSKPTRRKERS